MQRLISGTAATLPARRPDLIDEHELAAKQLLPWLPLVMPDPAKIASLAGNAEGFLPAATQCAIDDLMPKGAGFDRHPVDERPARAFLEVALEQAFLRKDRLDAMV